MSERVLYEFIPQDPELEGAPLRVIERDGEVMGQTVWNGEYKDAPCQFAVELGRVVERNARVVDVLRDLVSRCDGQEGIRSDGSNIDTAAAHAALSALEVAS